MLMGKNEKNEKVKKKLQICRNDLPGADMSSFDAQGHIPGC